MGLWRTAKIVWWIASAVDALVEGKMDRFKVMAKNAWTSVLGVLAGSFYYLTTSGAQLPQGKAGWMSLAVGALMAGLGLVSKDATTGSKPQ